MKKPLTSDEYIKEGANRCPFCRSTDITGESIEAYGTETWQEVGCQDCGAVWQDIYKLAEMFVLEEPTASYPA